MAGDYPHSGGTIQHIRPRWPKFSRIEEDIGHPIFGRKLQHMRQLRADSLQLRRGCRAGLACAMSGGNPIVL
jgi:hypothetical protein